MESLRMNLYIATMQFSGIYVQNNKCIVDNWDRNNQPICSHFHVNHSWKIGHTLHTILRERNLYYSKMEWNQVRIVFVFSTLDILTRKFEIPSFSWAFYIFHIMGLVFACSWKINTSQLQYKIFDLFLFNTWLVSSLPE